MKLITYDIDTRARDSYRALLPRLSKFRLGLKAEGASDIKLKLDGDECTSDAGTTSGYTTWTLSTLSSEGGQLYAIEVTTPNGTFTDPFLVVTSNDTCSDADCTEGQESYFTKSNTTLMTNSGIVTLSAQNLAVQNDVMAEGLNVTNHTLLNSVNVTGKLTSLSSIEAQAVTVDGNSVALKPTTKTAIAHTTLTGENVTWKITSASNQRNLLVTPTDNSDIWLVFDGTKTTGTNVQCDCNGYMIWLAGGTSENSEIYHVYNDTFTIPANNSAYMHFHKTDGFCFLAGWY